MSDLQTTYTKLRPKIKGKWLEYLRSDRFTQTVAKMRVTKQCLPSTIEQHGLGHCCLGVLNQLAVDESFLDTFTFNNRNQAPTRDVTDWAHLDRGAMKHLMGMNDGDYNPKDRSPKERTNRRNFYEIAEWIDANL
jgi:hypothetical protein